jgi:acylphosphatase
MIRIHMTVRGKVQGVGFRFYTQQQAETHEIKGWVKNNLDGTVEIDAEGKKADINRFLELVKRGSFNAVVKGVDAEESADIQGYESFSITS